MDLPSKLLEQIAVNTSPNIEEHMLIVMDKSLHEEHHSQPLQTNNKKFKFAVKFLTDFNGIYNVTNSNNRFYFKKTNSDEDGFIQITLQPGAHETENLNNEIKRVNIDEGHFIEANYPFTIEPNFSMLGFIIETSSQGP